MMYPQVPDLAAKDARIRVPIAVACRVLRFSTQGLYAWLKNPVSDGDLWDAHLTNAPPAICLLKTRAMVTGSPPTSYLPSALPRQRGACGGCVPNSDRGRFFQETWPEPKSRAARAAARTVPPLSSNKKGRPSENRCISCQPSPCLPSGVATIACVFIAGNSCDRADRVDLDGEPEFSVA